MIGWRACLGRRQDLKDLLDAAIHQGGSVPEAETRLKRVLAPRGGGIAIVAAGSMVAGLLLEATCRETWAHHLFGTGAIGACLVALLSVLRGSRARQIAFGLRTNPRTIMAILVAGMATIPVIEPRAASITSSNSSVLLEMS